MRFKDTVFKGGSGHLKLRHVSGGLILELKGQEIADAVHAGFIDPQRLHHSMYEYARMLREVGSVEVVEAPMDVFTCSSGDDDYLAGLDIGWN